MALMGRCVLSFISPGRWRGGGGLRGDWLRTCVWGITVTLKLCGEERKREKSVHGEFAPRPRTSEAFWDAVFLRLVTHKLSYSLVPVGSTVETTSVTTRTENSR